MDQGRQAGGEDDAAVMSSLPGQRSALAVERAGLQSGESVEADGVAEEDRPLVADELAAAAAAAGENGWPVGETCAVLLASVGRGPSDAAGARCDSAADLGAAFTGGVRAGGLPGRKDGEEKKEGWWSVRELRRNAPKSPG